MTLLRKCIEGFAFGIGLTVAILFVYTVYVLWAFPAVFERTVSEPGRTRQTDVDQTRLVAAAPALTSSSEYLGSDNMYSERFEMRGYGVLAAGPGRIVGDIRSGEQPVEGLKIRLGLNGSVMTPWVESDARGRYEIPVPLGDYRVDAFEIDRAAANRRLAGKIERPGRLVLGHTLSVAAGSAGAGPTFEFVDPVQKLGPTGTVMRGDPIVIEWNEFPGATAYELQLYKIPDPGDYAAVEPLFPHQDRPRVTNSSVSLSELGVSVEPGMHYRYSVSAYGERRVISETHDDYARPDFSVAE